METPTLTPVAPEFTTELYNTARTVALNVCRNNRALVEQTRKPLSELAHDLAAEIGLAHQRGVFDPERSAFATWCGTFAWGRLHDMARDRQGVERRESQHAESVKVGEVERINERKPRKRKNTKSKPNSRRHIPEFHRIPDRLGKRGPVGHGSTALMAAARYRRRERLTWKELALRLKVDPKLCLQLGFKHCPSWGALTGGPGRVAKFMRGY